MKLRAGFFLILVMFFLYKISIFILLCAFYFFADTFYFSIIPRVFGITCCRIFIMSTLKSLSDNSTTYFTLELQSVDSLFLYELMYSFSFIRYLIWDCISNILNPSL